MIKQVCRTGPNPQRFHLYQREQRPLRCDGRSSYTLNPQPYPLSPKA